MTKIQSIQSTIQNNNPIYTETVVDIDLLTEKTQSVMHEILPTLAQDSTPLSTDVVIDIPAEETDEEQLIPQKGRIITALGRDRLHYWCPTVGAVAGLVLGFYAANLVINLGIFFAVRQNTLVSSLQQANQKLTPYVGSCVSCTVEVAKEVMPSANAALLTELDAELGAVISANKENFKVLESVAANIGQASADASKTSILSSSAAKAAASFAKEASNGDVPLNFLSLPNVLGALGGAFTGYNLGEHLFAWLDS